MIQCSYDVLLSIFVLQVIVPLLVTEDEKTLVTCINCLTKVFSTIAFHIVLGKNNISAKVYKNNGVINWSRGLMFKVKEQNWLHDKHEGD